MTKADIDLDAIDFAAILEKPSTRLGQTLKGRRSLEKAALSEGDRRRMQTTGRTVQFNIKTRPMTKVEFIQAAQREGLLPTELFDRVWDHYKATVLDAEEA